MIKRISFYLPILFFVYLAKGQTDQETSSIKNAELVMSMTQRSLVMPGYLTELKALIAKQAYNFWENGVGDPYVSHLNVYSALHQANKYLDFDSTQMRIYNQVGYHSKRVTSIKFGDGNTYFSASADGTVMKWTLNSPDAIPENLYQSNNIIKSLDLSTDGSLLLATFYQTGIALIPTSQQIGDDVSILEDPEPVQTAVFIPNENRYLSVSKNGILNIKSFKSTEVEGIGSTSLKVSELIVDKSDGTIYAGTTSGTLEVWEKPYEVNKEVLSGIINEIETKSYFGYALGRYPINCMDISSDGKMLAIGRERGDVILWNIDSKQIQRVISSHQSAITDIDFSPDNQLLLTTSRDKTARIWELNDSRKLPIILDDHENWVYAGSFDPTGKTVITGSGDQFIRNWPVDPKEIADRICSLLSRDMTMDEWMEFVGKGVPYEKTCQR